jgi:hypothetical protein
VVVVGSVVVAAGVSSGLVSAVFLSFFLKMPFTLDRRLFNALGALVADPSAIVAVWTRAIRQDSSGFGSEKAQQRCGSVIEEDGDDVYGFGWEREGKSREKADQRE